MEQPENRRPLPKPLRLNSHLAIHSPNELRRVLAKGVQYGHSYRERILPNSHKDVMSWVADLPKTAQNWLECHQELVPMASAAILFGITLTRKDRLDRPTRNNFFYLGAAQQRFLTQALLMYDDAARSILAKYDAVVSYQDHRRDWLTNLTGALGVARAAQAAATYGLEIRLTDISTDAYSSIDLLWGPFPHGAHIALQVKCRMQAPEEQSRAIPLITDPTRPGPHEDPATQIALERLWRGAHRFDKTRGIWTLPVMVEVGLLGTPLDRLASPPLIDGFRQLAEQFRESYTLGYEA